jgi:hypothetical protein
VEGIQRDYADVLVKSLGDCSRTIKGPQMNIELDESIGVKPFKVNIARITKALFRQPSYFHWENGNTLWLLWV